MPTIPTMRLYIMKRNFVTFIEQKAQGNGFYK